MARYTHRVAISNRRIVAADDDAVAFRYKDYRVDHSERWKTMTLAPFEFIRRFLMHVLPKGFHRIRHYGLLASGTRAANLARARELIAASPTAKPARMPEPAPADPDPHPESCPCCGAPMRVIERFEAGRLPRHQPSPRPPAANRIDTS